MAPTVQVKLLCYQEIAKMSFPDVNVLEPKPSGEGVWGCRRWPGVRVWSAVLCVCMCRVRALHVHTLESTLVSPGTALSRCRLAFAHPPPTQRFHGLSSVSGVGGGSGAAHREGLDAVGQVDGD